MPKYSTIVLTSHASKVMLKILKARLQQYVNWKLPNIQAGFRTSNEYSGPVSFRMDCLDFFAVQGTLKRLLQHHSSKTWILWCSAFFIVQLSHPYMTTGKNTALTLTREAHFIYRSVYMWASLVAQTVKNPPAIQDTWVWSLGWEDPLKEGMATHSRILAWRIPRTEEPGSLQSIGSQRVKHDWATKHSTTSCTRGERIMQMG